MTPHDETPAREDRAGHSPATRKSRWLSLGIPAVIVAAVLWALWTRQFDAIAPKAALPPPAPARPAEPVDPNTVILEGEQAKHLVRAAVNSRVFQEQRLATGKIAFNEDRVTPVFSPYTGRVVRLLAKPGDTVEAGSALFELDTPDLVQANADFLTALSGLTKARNTLDQAKRTEARQQRLYQAKAGALKDWEQAQSDVRSAESDLRSAEGTLAGARDRLRSFGKSEEDIARLEASRQIERVTTVRAPIAGTITMRKVGPGQFVRPDNVDPTFTIADLSTMWLSAQVAEADIPFVRLGQPVEVQVLAYPKETFRARLTYVGPALDPAVRRLPVRAEVADPHRRLKPEMFASFRIATTATTSALAVPTNAIVREGGKTTVWVAESPTRFVRRAVTLGFEQGGVAQIVAGLQPGEQVITEGAVFLDRVQQTASQ